MWVRSQAHQATTSVVVYDEKQLVKPVREVSLQQRGSGGSESFQLVGTDFGILEVE